MENKIRIIICLACGLASAAIAGCSPSQPGGTEKIRDAGVTDFDIHEGSTRDYDGSVNANDLSGDLALAAPVASVPLTMVGGAYAAQVTIGTQNFQVFVDTGSTTLAVAGATCTSCGVSPTYTPDPTATDEHVSASETFGDSSGWSGEVYQDAVSLGAGAVAPVKFVAMSTQTNFYFDGGLLQGVLGLAPAGSAAAGTDGYFDDLVASAHVPNLFAFELCPTAGTLWLGGYDPTFVTAPPQYVPMPTSSVSLVQYPVALQSVTIAGTSIAIPTVPNAVSILDTGTVGFVVPNSAFMAMTSAIATSSAFQQIFGGGTAAGAIDWLSNQSSFTSVTQTKAELDAMLPPLTMVFGSSPEVSVSAVATESYLHAYPQGGVTYWFPGIQVNDPGAVGAIIGTSVLASNVVIFDRANKRIGFAPHTPCAIQ